MACFRAAFLLAVLLAAPVLHAEPDWSGMRSVRDFGMSPDKSAADNKVCLQAAIDWSAQTGGTVLVNPSEKPYKVASGLILKANASLVGANDVLPRGNRSPAGATPMGSVFCIEDDQHPFITVEGATRLRGIQFWYPKQTRKDPDKVIAYPPTLRVSQTRHVDGVSLADLTFYGEYTAMDFAASAEHPCELITIERCHGYPLSGRFITIDRCYDIPRILHCHVNPAVSRAVDGGCSPELVAAVTRLPTYAYWIDHTDNAQCIDLFAFGTHGGIYLGPATYGQLTNFNFDSVAVGIHKCGDGDFNRSWQIAQGSIIANCGAKPGDIHPILVEGRGHIAISNVEAFCGRNAAVAGSLAQSQDFLHVQGDQKLTLTLVGARMRNYAAKEPVTSSNPKAVIRVLGCFDGQGALFER